MTDVHEAADRLVRHPLAPPPSMGELEGRGARRRRRRQARRVTLPVLGAGAVVLALALLVTSGRAPERLNVGPTGSPATSETSAVTLPPVSHPADALPIDIDEVRLWVPPGWTAIAPDTSVSGCGPGAVILSPGATTCSSPYVIVTTKTGPPTPGWTHIRQNDLDVWMSSTFGSATPTPVSIDIPSLGTEVTAYGPAANDILPTVGTSALHAVLQAGPNIRAPASWKTIRYQGIQAKVPAAWPTGPPPPCPSINRAHPAVALGAGVEDASCPDRIERTPAADGLELAPVNGPTAGTPPPPPGTIIKTVSGPHTGLAVGLFDAPGADAGSTVGIYLTTGISDSMVGTVGLGVDPSIAEEIIDSLTLYQPSPMTRAPTPVLPSPAQQAASQLSHSGGPYVSPLTIERTDLTGLGCPLPANLTGTTDTLPAGSPGSTPGNRCTSVTVRFFPTFTAAASALPGLVQPGGINADREIYVVTVHGRFTFETTSLASPSGAADHWNSEYDATTGAFLGGGTAGSPLP